MVKYINHNLSPLMCSKCQYAAGLDDKFRQHLSINIRDRTYCEVDARLYGMLLEVLNTQIRINLQYRFITNMREAQAKIGFSLVEDI